MIASIILAAGKGTRMGSSTYNKVSIPFQSKPMVQYGVDLLSKITSPVVVVVGAFAESVKESLNGYDVIFVEQKEQSGTGNAVVIGAKVLQQYSPHQVLVGYADHLMYYKKETVENLIDLHKKENTVISLISTVYRNPDSLSWGRIVRNNSGEVVNIVEQKDATIEERKITELNAGFYCFDFNFLISNLSKLKKSPVTDEYYINEFIKIAVDDNLKVVGITIPFEEVGFGINNKDDIEKSQKYYHQVHRTNL